MKIVILLLMLCLTLAYVSTLPEHKFFADVKQITQSDGTITKKTTISLIEGAYKFTRKKCRTGKAYFNCRNMFKGCKASAKVALAGNLPTIFARISAHKKSIGAVLHTGMAKSHIWSNPKASLRTEQLYGIPVLLSGLGCLDIPAMHNSIFNESGRC